MSPFDPQQFLNTPAGPMATQVSPSPEGNFVMHINIDQPMEGWFREVKWTDKDGNARSAPSCEIPIIITDDSARQIAGRDKLFSRYRFFLDLDKNGNLDTGPDRNVKLGQLRAALGQNNDPSWTLARLFTDKPFMGVNTQTQDRKDPSKKYAEVTRVTKLG